MIDLVIPPAWEQVWICRDPLGHLQATGIDQKGRKQYRYHDRWAEAVHEAKFADLSEFGRSLGSLRQQIDGDLRRHAAVLARIVALAVTLVDKTGARIGSREYTRDNETYGLTTLHKRHATVRPTYLRLRYTGKSHQSRDLRVTSRRLARHLGRAKEAPGEALFRYHGTAGWCDLHSDQVNEYLHHHAGGGASAKRFRTWLGSLIAFRAMQDGLAARLPLVKAQRSAVRAAAQRLGNTVAVCRSHYIHPAVLRMQHAIRAEQNESSLIEYLEATC